MVSRRKGGIPLGSGFRPSATAKRAQSTNTAVGGDIFVDYAWPPTGNDYLIAPPPTCQYAKMCCNLPAHLIGVFFLFLFDRQTMCLTMRPRRPPWPLLLCALLDVEALELDVAVALRRAYHRRETRVMRPPGPSPTCSAWMSVVWRNAVAVVCTPAGTRVGSRSSARPHSTMISGVAT